MLSAREIAPPILCDARELSQLLKLSLRTIRMMDQSGLLPEPLRLSRNAIRWRVDEIRDWLAAGGPRREQWVAMKAAKASPRRSSS